MVMADAPAPSTRLATSAALISRSSQPLRIFTVTGMRTALTIAEMIRAACSGSASGCSPAWCLAIFGTGQPMFTSTMFAPIPSTMRAASAMRSGSPPKIWIDTGRSASVYPRIQRPIDPADQPLAAHHLGDDQPASALPLDQPAERRIRHPRHRGDDERRFQRHVTDSHRTVPSHLVICESAS